MFDKDILPKKRKRRKYGCSKIELLLLSAYFVPLLLLRASLYGPPDFTASWDLFLTPCARILFKGTMSAMTDGKVRESK